MQIELVGLGKKFDQHRLFKNLNTTFENGNTYAITGENGSGKSTLLKIIAGFTSPSEGQVLLKNPTEIKKENYFSFFNICAPYQELIQELTLAEHLSFHHKFKQPDNPKEIEDILQETGLYKSISKPIREFSSGMQQRVKLILSLCYKSKIILLDEPTSHLDSVGIEWYQHLMEKKINNRITLIFSNNKEEYLRFTNETINISNN